MSETLENRRSSSGTPIWAFILIAVGVVWLLLQANILSGANLAVLFRLWPIILIAIGLELLIGRKSRALSLIIGGGTMEINGILYFPSQPLKITGNGDIGTSSAQFAIMADTIAIEGNGQLNIKIGQNYQDTGLPDLPEADEIVRLTE